jgi:hypothetical protein
LCLRARGRAVVLIAGERGAAADADRVATFTRVMGHEPAAPVAEEAWRAWTLRSR